MNISFKRGVRGELAVVAFLAVGQIGQRELGESLFTYTQGKGINIRIKRGRKEEMERHMNMG